LGKKSAGGEILPHLAPQKNIYTGEMGAISPVDTVCGIALSVDIYM
jgi:hypothetical protein